MTARRLVPIATAAVLLGLPLAGCSDGTAPSAGSIKFHTLRFDQSGLHVWRYAGTEGAVVSPDTLSIVLDFAAAPDGRMAYVTYDVNAFRLAIAEYDAEGRALRLVRTGPVLPNPDTAPRDLAYSPDGLRLAWTWLRSNGVDSLFLLDPGATAARGIAERAFVAEGGDDGAFVEAARMRWSPQGEMIFGAPGTLVAIDGISGSAHTIVSGAGYIADYDFTADGRVALSSRTSFTNGARLLAQRTAGGPLLDFVPGGSPFAHRVRWSPDGARLATVAPDTTYDGTGGIYGEGAVLMSPALQVIPVNGGGRPTNKGIAIGEIVGWTRDGRVLVTGALAGVRGEVGDVFVVPTHGAPINLTNTPGIDERIVK